MIEIEQAEWGGSKKNSEEALSGSLSDKMAFEDLGGLLVLLLASFLLWQRSVRVAREEKKSEEGRNMVMGLFECL